MVGGTSPTPPAADLQLPVDVRRPRPYEALAIYASSPTWTRCRACTSPRAACTPWPRPGRRRGAAGVELPLRHVGRPHPARVGHHRAGDGRGAHRWRASSRPTRWSATPTSRWPTARCCPASTRRGWPAAARTRRRASSGTSGCGAPPPDAAHHNIHFGSDWDGAFEAMLAGRAHARPVDPGDPAHSRRPGMAPEGCTLASTCSSPPPTSTDGRLGRRADPGSKTTSAAGWRPRLPHRGRGRGARGTRSTGSARAWSGARRSRCPTSSARPAIFRPGNVDKRAPGLVFVGSGTLPGVGVPMVLVSGKLAAERVDQLAGRRGGERPSRSRRATSGAGSSTSARHHLLLVHPGAAP
jgi:hypothetical protein